MNNEFDKGIGNGVVLIIVPNHVIDFLLVCVLFLMDHSKNIYKVSLDLSYSFYPFSYIYDIMHIHYSRTYLNTIEELNNLIINKEIRTSFFINVGPFYKATISLALFFWSL